MNNSTVVIGGATASGKTSLAVHLAEILQDKWHRESEIINADSVQMYSDLKILTAYPSAEELSRVKHNLFGILQPYESSSVASWLERTKIELERIHSAEKIAIVCGGTGFYLRALLSGIADIPPIPNSIHENTKICFEKIGRDAFFEKLAEMDPVSVQKLHKNDTQRILRAYEVILHTGKPLSEWWKEESSSNHDKHLKKMPIIVLLPDREPLRERAKIRIHSMIANGAVEEVQKFSETYPEYNGPLKEVIGYREICAFLGRNGVETQDKLIEKMRIRTNQYIKRQSTWFRNQLKNAKFICDFGNTLEALDETANFVMNFYE